MCIYDHGFCSQKSCGEMRISMTRISVRLLFQVISCWNNGWRELSFSLSLSEMKEMAIKLLQMIKCANGSRCMAKFNSCIFSGPMACKRGRVKVKNAIKIVRACCIWSERKSPNATASMCASSWVMILINWCIARVACVCIGTSHTVNSSPQKFIFAATYSFRSQYYVLSPSWRSHLKRSASATNHI